jgi:hypothetical protein
MPLALGAVGRNDETQASRERGKKNLCIPHFDPFYAAIWRIGRDTGNEILCNFVT